MPTLVNPNEVEKIPVRMTKEGTSVLPVEEKINKEREIPEGYIEVKLDSLGKLSAPTILHFRNYNGAEAIELSTRNEDNFIDALVKCLNNMVWEDFDCGNLNEQELVEVMLSIYRSFWGNNLQGWQFYLFEDINCEEAKALEIKDFKDPKNIDDAVIDISKLETKPIMEGFKEPIKVTVNNKIVKFRLPRINDYIYAREYVLEKYYEESRRLSDLEEKINKKQTVTYQDNKKYEDYLQRRASDLLLVVQACTLVEVNGIKLETLEEKINNYNEVTLDHWTLFNDTVKEKLQFGINPEIEVFSMKLKKPVVRRFSFQPMDLIPTMDIQRDSGNAVSFGD
jgi:hypothetical protein